MVVLVVFPCAGVVLVLCCSVLSRATFSGVRTTFSGVPPKFQCSGVPCFRFVVDARFGGGGDEKDKRLTEGRQGPDDKDPLSKDPLSIGRVSQLVLEWSY